MKMKFIYKIVFAFSIGFSGLTVTAQQVNTMYFMENVPIRNSLNPAFQPLGKFYIGITPLGFTQFSISNNSLSLKDIIYPDANGKLILFLNGNKDLLYNNIQPTMLFQSNLQLNLLDFGFRVGKSYINFSITEKVEAQLGIPQEFMKLLLYGTPNALNNIYNFKTLGFDATVYTEAAVGFSRKINDTWSYGAKFKFLYGSMNISTDNQNLNLTAGYDKWKINGLGTANYSGPYELQGNTLKSIKMIAPTTTGFIQPAGMGGGIDLGFTFKPINKLTFSGAIIDLGIIHWSQNASKIDYTVGYTFNGLGKNDLLNVKYNTDLSNRIDSLTANLKDSVKTSITSNSYNTYTTPKLNLGVEYGFFKNKMSLGVLSRTMFHDKSLIEEITGSVNAHPNDWFNLSLSYSIMNSRMSNIGAGLGLRTGIIHWFMSADYISIDNASYNIGGFNAPLPYNSKGFSFAFGAHYVFGNRKDADKDGIVDGQDKCPETPFSVIVDKKGCPADTDGDGVPDYLDKCANTPPEAYNKIDIEGCPFDLDGDSVPDYLDKCADTPNEAIGHVDKQGCSLDTDNDGVFDYLDKCANTPSEINVDSVGCPLDMDGDGVADYLDLCSDTPIEAHGKVDKNGCALDRDSDAVYDYLDLCPNTPFEARELVDKNGCSLDSDDDGVPDYLDKCPKTSIDARGMVDEKGCPRDTDGDGISDYLDNCPKLPGVVSNKGCPEIKKEVRTLFQKALQGIQFETGKAIIKKTSYIILNQIAQVLINNPTYLIEVQGHTDNVGNKTSNLLLSEKRAVAVKDYLIKNGVALKRIISKGFGDSIPVADNKTTAGKSKNRRVEFVVTFEETDFK